MVVKPSVTFRTIKIMATKTLDMISKLKLYSNFTGSFGALYSHWLHKNHT